MDPLKPLGKALSQNPLLGNDVPLSAPPGAAPEQPISAFQWVSLAKATWTWILRPIWYLCFNGPHSCWAWVWPHQKVGATTDVRIGRESMNANCTKTGLPNGDATLAKIDSADLSLASGPPTP